MSNLDEKVERRLGILCEPHGGQWRASFDIPGISISGHGETPDRAKYLLVLRIMLNAPAYMHRVQKQLGIILDELHLGVSYEFPQGGRPLIHVSDEAGRTKTIPAPWKGGE
jgi:hypothetical protein